jgi:release factor glutamine methyltransferase
VTYHLLRQRILRELRAFLDPIEAQQEVRRWFEEGLGLDAVWMAQHGVDAVTVTKERRVEMWLKRRLQGEPWALILGRTNFCGRPFKVSQVALIPQLESETTVKVALEVGRTLGIRRCADVGAGVGNIGLTLALETDWELMLTEIDPAALKIAKANGRSLGAKARYVVGDLLHPVPDPIELVVANMPFVDELQAASLEADFNFEPAIAMLAADGGIGLSTALLGQAQERGAWACVVEIGAGQGRELRSRALDQGWPRVSVLQDAQGQDRVIVAGRARL